MRLRFLRRLMWQERGAKVTLLGAVLFTTFTIWAVHWQQDQEREVRHFRKTYSTLRADFAIQEYV